MQQEQLTIEEKNDFVFRNISDRNNWTEDVVAGLMSRAHVAPPASETKCRKMAIKFLWILCNSERIRGKGKGWIPTQSCVDLTTTGAALTRAEEEMSVDEVRETWATDQVKVRKIRHVRRHFKNCKYDSCGKRFLAKRANQEFCTKKCGLRWNRANATPSLMLESAQVATQPA